MSINDNNPTEELHERFRAELKKPVRERYFDEDDLLNVIDTASDTYDDYLRIEALLLGARLYPDSVALLERRAIYYLDTDAQMFEQFMTDYADTQSVMMDILHLNLLEGQPYDSIVANVEEFLKDFRFEEDEEVIQFVQTLVTLKLDQWLIDNLERLKGITPYLPSLLYEYAFAGDDSPLMATISAKVLEELTEIEPYVADYWTRLAIAYSRDGKPDEALAAIDYALAISPDNAPALRTRMHLSNIAEDPKLLGETLDKLLKLEPDDPEVAFLKVVSAQSPDEANALIDTFSPQARASRSMVMHAIRSRFPNLSHLLEDAYDGGVTAREDWTVFADFAYECHNLPAINDVFQTYQKKSGEDIRHDYLIFQIMFDSGNYAVATNIYTNAEAGSSLLEEHNVLKGYSRFIVSLLRLGDLASAREGAVTMLNALDNDELAVGSDLERRAMKAFLEDVLKRLAAKRNTNWHKYEPL